MKERIRLLILYLILCFISIFFAKWLWPNDLEKSKTFVTYLFGVWSVVNVLFMLKLTLPKNQNIIQHSNLEANTGKDLIQDVLKFPINEWDEVEKKIVELQKLNVELQHQINSEKTNFQQLIESFPTPIFIINEEQQFVFMNRKLREDFHFQDDLNNSTHLLHVLRDHELQETIEKTLKQKVYIRSEISLFALNDQNRLYYTIFTSFLPQFGNYSNCVLGVLIETTEQKLTQKMREEFVANVSHEIRTPLTILMGQLQLLDQSIQNLPGAKDLSVKVQSNSTRLLSLINELLELSKLEAQGRIEKEKIEIDGLIESILFDLNLKYTHLNIEMLTCFDSHVAYVNPKLFDQLMLNLLENAFKYNKTKGSIYVHVFEDNNLTKILIKDTGIGIPENQLHRIFERFFRVDRSRSSHIEGTGLGLSVVKHIVQKHLGQIKVTSIEKEGTTFEISLPLT